MTNSKLDHVAIDDPLVPANWAQIKLVIATPEMTKWCSDNQQLERGRDWMLHSQVEFVWLRVGGDDVEPLELRTTQKFNYFFFKNPSNATAFALKFYEHCNH